MTTVSLVECNTPVSLRTCGSSVSSLFHNRKRLQCYSPNKRAISTRPPDSRGRLSVSPHFGLEGALVSSPLQSPLPRAIQSPYSRCQSKLTYEQHYGSSSSSSSEEFSDDDLADSISSNESCDISFDDLLVVGSKPKIYGKFDVPKLKNIKVSPYLIKSAVSTPFPQTKPEILPDRDSSPSPENPPPSPINFRPSLDGFIVGGRKLSCPERASSSCGAFYSSKDFNPGYVKQPMYHCVKCEGRVMEEEKTEVALQRRLSFIMNNRASHHRRLDAFPTNVCSKHGQTGKNPEESVPISPNSLTEQKSFIEIYKEKKREKQLREKEMQENRMKRREEMRKEEELKKKERMKKRIERIDSRTKALVQETSEKRSTFVSAGFDVKTKKEECESGVKYDTASSLSIFPPSGSEDTSSSLMNDVTLPPLSSTPTISPNQPKPVQRYGNLSDLSVVNTLDEDPPSKTASKPVNMEKKADSEIGKWQMRRCWSDIWPFPQDVDVNAERQIDSDDDTEDHFLKSTGKLMNKNRKTPMHPLQKPPITSHMKEQPLVSKSRESLTSSQSLEMLSVQDVKIDINVSQTPDETVDSVTAKDLIEQEGSETSITMTATVIVPEKDKPCTQWVTFNADNEPVLNTGPEKEDGCDTFLKRLQRSKVYNNSDPSLPSGQQFCFEAMVDKRYNRWKRRRRKKKESEMRRSTIPQSSDSSDDERNSAVENILDRMYEKMNGPIPQTPNGSKDTPRMRNRRRRKDLDGSTPLCTTFETSDVQYDASSEWTSDKDVGLFVSASGTDKYRTNSSRKYPEHASSSNGNISDELCEWPYLEHYKQEILRRIQNTPPDQLEDLDQKDWLPDITSRGQSRASGSVNNPDQPEAMDQSESLPDLPVRGQSRTSSKNSDSMESEANSGPQTPVEQVLSNNPEPSANDKPLTPEKKPETTKTRFDGNSTSYSYAKWSRSQRTQSRKNSISTEESSRSRLLSRTSASSWSELGLDPTVPKCVGVVSIGEASEDKAFNASLRPIKRNSPLVTSRSKLPRKLSKEQSPPKRQNVNLPVLTKNIKSQTIPLNLKIDKSSKRSNTPTGQKQNDRTKQDNQSGPGNRKEKTSTTGSQNLLFRDYYLRSLYNNKVRINSHVESFNTGGRLKKAITVDSIDLGSRRTRKKSEESKISALSFTRSFTFSMFDLPDMHRLYNMKIERKANGEDVDL